MTGWSPNVYVCIGDVEFWVYIAKNGLVGLYNSLEVDIDEEIVRVDMLFDQAFDLQKCWKKIPFVLGMVRLVLTALSITYMTGDARFENVDLIFTQPGYSSDVRFELGIISDKSLCLHSFVRYQHKVPWYIRDDAT